MEHLAIFTRMEGLFWKFITPMILKNWKTLISAHKIYLYIIKFDKIAKMKKRCKVRALNPQIATLSFNWLSYEESFQILYK